MIVSLVWLWVEKQLLQSGLMGVGCHFEFVSGKLVALRGLWCCRDRWARSRVCARGDLLEMIKSLLVIELRLVVIRPRR